MLLEIGNDFTRLTGREHEVLELTAAGLTSKQVAQQIGIAPRTVERHLDNARLKFGARNRAHMISKALKAGVLEVLSHGDQRTPIQLKLELDDVAG